jgi:hypothetical protein
MARGVRFGAAMRLVPLLGFVAIAAACAPALADEDDVYARPESWLCRRGASDLCAAPTTAVVVHGDGSRETKVWKLNPDAPIDCFYVYPTISEDPNGNSSMVPGDGEKRAVALQFAPFASVCRPFAPMYRQVTLAGIAAVLEDKPLPVDMEVPYSDVLAAWRHYLAVDNHGRGVVLIGHSQGSRLLARLIAETIDGKPEQSLLAGAILLGFNVEVPVGADVGGTFESIPLCRAAGQTGCVVAYETFRASDPPRGSSRFTHARKEGMEVACTDPATLSGEKLDPVLATGMNLLGQPLTDPAWSAFVKPLDAAFISLPDAVDAHCARRHLSSYLAVSMAEPQTPGAWPPDLPGDLVVHGRTLEGWGLHLIDVNVAMGNLIDFVGRLRKPAR